MTQLREKIKQIEALPSLLQASWQSAYGEWEVSMCEHSNQLGGDGRDGDLTHLMNLGIMRLKLGPLWYP